MADYCSVQDVKDMIEGVWGVDTNRGPGSANSRDTIIASLITATSREFDRETDHATNFWATATAVTRKYRGDGSPYLDIDDFDTISAVSMASRQDRSDSIALTLTDATSANYVSMLPLQGPPYSQLFLLRGFFPDTYDIGNVLVTGGITTPAEITQAVAIWVGYKYRARQAAWQDAAARSGQPGQLFKRGIPPDVQRIIDYYKDEPGKGLKAALIGSGEDRMSPWMGWRTQ